MAGTFINGYQRLPSLNIKSRFALTCKAAFFGVRDIKSLLKRVKDLPTTVVPAMTSDRIGGRSGRLD